MRRLLLGISMLLLGAAHSPAATIVRLHARAEATTPIVTLGDVAEIIDNRPRRVAELARIELQPAPAPAEHQWLDLVGLKDRLHRRGVNLTELEFRGAGRIEIVRAALDEPANQPIVRRPEPTKSAQEWEALVQRLLRRSIAQSTGMTDESFRLSIRGKRAFDFLEQGGADRLELRPLDRWRPGANAVELEIPKESRVTKFAISAKLSVERTFVVPRSNLSRGAEITADDIELVSRFVTEFDQRFVREPSEVLGRHAAKALAANRPIERTQVKSKPIVFRGSRVTVRVRTGNLALLDMFAVAREDGGLGDWIEVVNPESKKPLETKVRVTGLQRAELPLDAPELDSSATRDAVARRATSQQSQGKTLSSQRR